MTASADGQVIVVIFPLRILPSGTLFDPSSHVLKVRPLQTLPSLTYEQVKATGVPQFCIVLLPPVAEFSEQQTFTWLLKNILVGLFVERRANELLESPGSAQQFSERIVLSFDGEVCHIQACEHLEEELKEHKVEVLKFPHQLSGRLQPMDRSKLFPATKALAKKFMTKRGVEFSSEPSAEGSRVRIKVEEFLKKHVPSGQGMKPGHRTLVLQFFAHYVEVMTAAAIPTTIIEGFRVCGLLPGPQSGDQAEQCLQNFPEWYQLPRETQSAALAAVEKGADALLKGQELSDSVLQSFGLDTICDPVRPEQPNWQQRALWLNSDAVRTRRVEALKAKEDQQFQMALQREDRSMRRLSKGVRAHVVSNVARASSQQPSSLSAVQPSEPSTPPRRSQRLPKRSRAVDNVLLDVDFDSMCAFCAMNWTDEKHGGDWVACSYVGCPAWSCAKCQAQGILDEHLRFDNHASS